MQWSGKARQRTYEALTAKLIDDCPADKIVEWVAFIVADCNRGPTMSRPMACSERATQTHGVFGR